jgi:hypothetical protein
VTKQPLDAPGGDDEGAKLHPRAAGIALFAIDGE